jgi:hypothetical protein
VTVRDADVEYAFDDPDEGWFGMARPVDAAPARPVAEPSREEHSHDDADLSTDTDRWFVEDVEKAATAGSEARPHDTTDRRPVPESVAASVDAMSTRRRGVVRAAPSSSRESRLSDSGAWDFKVSSDHSRNRRKVLAIAGAVLVAAAAVVGVVVLIRSPGSPVEPSTTVAPSAPSAPPAPTNSAPVLTTQAPLPPPPPPGPPPPPPPTAEELNPPVNRQYTPRYQAPQETSKPEINVTRAPMSATPPPPPKPDRNSSKPGDGRKRGGFGW